MRDGIQQHTRLDNGSFCLETQRWVPKPLDDVFAFFSDAYNLADLTPPFVRFEILTPPPIQMAVGALIDYRIRLHGFPIRWRTQITKWEPPHSFEDIQIKGPYTMWQHKHTFTAQDDGTLCQDKVIYRVPGGLLIQKLVVGGDVERIFSYRDQQMKRIFG